MFLMFVHYLSRISSLCVLHWVSCYHWTSESLKFSEDDSQLIIQLQFNQFEIMYLLCLMSVQSGSSTHHDDGVGDSGVVDGPGGHQTGHGQETAALWHSSFLTHIWSLTHSSSVRAADPAHLPTDHAPVVCDWWNMFLFFFSLCHFQIQKPFSCWLTSQSPNKIWHIFIESEMICSKKENKNKPDTKHQNLLEELLITAVIVLISENFIS